MTRKKCNTDGGISGHYRLPIRLLLDFGQEQHYKESFFSRPQASGVPMMCCLCGHSSDLAANHPGGQPRWKYTHAVSAVASIIVISSKIFDILLRNNNNNNNQQKVKKKVAEGFDPNIGLHPTTSVLIQPSVSIQPHPF